MTKIHARHLKPGERIPTTLCGDLSVIATPMVDPDPSWARTYVDVEVEDKSGRWDVEHLPAAAGAEAFHFHGLAPLRYRLVYLPDAMVEWEPAPDARTVRLPLRRDGQILVYDLEIATVCPVCGGPRGLPYNQHGVDGIGWYQRWDNPCGHIEDYDGLIADAEAGR